MTDLVRIHFFVDEHLPAHAVGRILEARGHRSTPVQVGLKDPAILVTAAEVGAVIVTADHWFLRELYRYPLGHKRQYGAAGVVQVLGEWATTRQRLTDYLPVVEAVYQLRRSQPDQRLGIDLSQTMIRIHGPEHHAPTGRTSGRQAPR